LGLNRKIAHIAAPQWPRSTVIDQSPLAGTRLTSTTEVDLTIAN